MILRSIGKSPAAILLWIFLGVHAARAVTFQTSYPTEFSKIIDTNAVLTTNAIMTNIWLEGPTWIPAVPASNGYLVFCNQDSNKLQKLVPPTNVTDFLLPPANTKFNGTLLDAQERLICAEAGSAGQRISMISNGIVTPLVTNWNGLKFYSPNDVAVKSDGTIWFTDPGYNSGITRPHAGYPSNYCVYQFHPTNANATCRPVITNGIVRPNGLCFSPDETKLYVADSDGGQPHIRAYSVTSSNTLINGTNFPNITTGSPDGIKCDVDGRVWSSGGDAIYIFAADGRLIGKIIYGLTVNFCWGGPQYKTLYIVGRPLVTSIPVLVSGTASMKKLQSTFDGNQLNLSWPAPSTGFALQETEQLNPPAAWTNSPLTVTTTNGQKMVNVDATNSAKFFRLRLN